MWRSQNNLIFKLLYPSIAFCFEQMPRVGHVQLTFNKDDISKSQNLTGK